MTPRLLPALLAGGAVGAGLLLVAAGWRPAASAAERRTAGSWSGRGWRVLPPARLAEGVAAAGVVLVVTRWVAVAAAAGAVVAARSRLFGAARRERAALARLDAVAAWTETLRDLVAAGLALPEVLPLSVAGAAPLIQSALTALTERLAAREPLESALRALADDLDDPGADLVVAALLLNARAQGRALREVLGGLAAATRGELGMRRAVDADRRSTRRAVQVVVATTVVTAALVTVLNPGYVAPYRTLSGQLVLAVVVGIFAAGFTWLARLAAIPTAPRLLRSVTHSAHAGWSA